MSTTDNTGSWLYGIVRAPSAGDRVRDLFGVAGEPIRVVVADDLAAAVGTIPLEEFGQDALRRNLEDLDWLAAKARAHDAVISALTGSGAVVPVRMATVYLDDARVHQLLQNRRQDFLAALELVSHREELGVKAYADPAALADEDESEPPSPAQRPSGTAYLLRRRRELSAQEKAYEIAAAAAERIHAELQRHAVDGKRKPASDQSLSGRSGWLVLNGTYLVDLGNLAAFRDVVAALDKECRGIDLEITGPWPPYSFAGDVVT